MSDTENTVLGEVLVILEERLRARNESADVDPDQPLGNAGIDSLDLIVVLTELEQRHGFEFENEAVDVDYHQSARGLAAWIASKSN